MIRLELARELRRSGPAWTPVPGDRFVVPDRDMDDEVFVVSDMAIEVHGRRDGQVLRFNGTTEWALDSLESTDVLWLPREDQLRAMLGEHFRSLLQGVDGWTVEVVDQGEPASFTDPDAECAYARAVLSLL